MPKNVMKKILVVEDEQILLKDLADKFTKEGFEVFTAGDGQEGLNIAFKNHPDLILLDIVMPIMDGMTMLYQLRKDLWGKSAQVILLTNLTDSGKIADSFLENVHDYLVKSDWTLDEIATKVKSRLGE
jgi:two-component system alkaline phosphatase synthesis response regulator PhoP